MQTTLLARPATAGPPRYRYFTDNHIEPVFGSTSL